MTERDYSVFNMPMILGTAVKKQDPLDPTKWIRDESWYENARERYTSVLNFLQQNGLLRRAVLESADGIDRVVLRASDLTPEGSQFVKSNAIGRWLSSFDRQGSMKTNTDISYLQKALEKLRK